MNAIELLLREHARTHASALGGAEGGAGFEDLVFMFGEFTEDQLRQRPQEGTNSIAWLIWHMARTEDMGVNITVSDGTPVLESEGWSERLRLTRHDTGVGMSDEEVMSFTQRVDVEQLRNYRTAVGRRTREVVSAMQPEELDEPIDVARIERAFAQSILPEQAGWMRDYYAGKTKAFVLGHQAIGHNFMHLGEALCVRSLLGQPLPL